MAEGMTGFAFEDVGKRYIVTARRYFQTQTPTILFVADAYYKKNSRRLQNNVSLNPSGSKRFQPAGAER